MKDMEQILIENTEEKYYDIKKNFTFNNKIYKTSVNFAYLNTNIDLILNRYNIVFDESWMMLKAFTESNYRNYMNMIVGKLYGQHVSVEVAQDVIFDIVTLINKLCNLFNSGRRIDLDLSIVSIAKASIKNKQIRELMGNKHRITPDDTPERINEVRNYKKNMYVNNVYIPGIYELLNSGYAIKEDQMVNIFGGIDMIPRIHNIDEMFPRSISKHWLDGISNKDEFFMLANVNAYALYMTKTIIERSGSVNKISSMIAQDCTITEKDCGTKHYQTYHVANSNDLKTLRFKYMLNDNNQLEEITLNHTHLIGKDVQVRSIFKCASTHDGVCETCFGASARWNRSTKQYRKDLGVEFTKMIISPPSQDILSTKHNTSPKLEPFEISYKLIGDIDKEDIDFTQIDPTDNEFFTRKFNNIIWKPNVKVYLDKGDCKNKLFESRRQSKLKKKDIDIITTNDTKTLVSKPIEYIDNEFGEIDIIRASALIVKKDNVEYKLFPNSHFRIHGFPRDKFSLLGEPRILKLTKENRVTHVIRNYAKTKKFFEIENLYKLSTPSHLNKFKLDNEDGMIRQNNIIENDEAFIEKVVECFPNEEKVALEIVFRNKIRDANNKNLLPNWKLDNPEAIVLSDRVTVNARPSLSLKISAGYIKQRVNNPLYHDISRLQNTSYDRIYHMKNIEEE